MWISEVRLFISHFQFCGYFTLHNVTQKPLSLMLHFLLFIFMVESCLC